jgi:hypothetical protein
VASNVPKKSPDNKAQFECAYDAAIAAGQTAAQAAEAGTKATRWYEVMVNRLGAQVTKFPPNRNTLTVEAVLNLPLR